MVTDVSKIVDSPEMLGPEREGAWFLLNVDKYCSVNRRMTVMNLVTLNMKPLCFFRNVRVCLPHVISQKNWLRTDSFPSGFSTKILCEIKSEVHHKTGHEGPEGSRCVALLFL
jgi:hypothetical protein